MFLSPIDRSALNEVRAKAEDNGQPVILPAHIFLGLMALKDILVQQRDRAQEDRTRRDTVMAAVEEYVTARGTDAQVVALVHLRRAYGAGR